MHWPWKKQNNNTEKEITELKQTIATQKEQIEMLASSLSNIHTVVELLKGRVFFLEFQMGNESESGSIQE